MKIESEFVKISIKCGRPMFQITLMMRTPCWGFLASKAYRLLVVTSYLFTYWKIKFLNFPSSGGCLIVWKTNVAEFLVMVVCHLMASTSEVDLLVNLSIPLGSISSMGGPRPLTILPFSWCESMKGSQTHLLLSWGHQPHWSQLQA